MGNFWSGLTSGLLGFATGGPIGAAAGLLAGFSGGGGGSSQTNQQSLASLQTQKAMLDGYQLGMGQGSGLTYNPQAAQQPASAARGGGSGAIGDQQANARGGQNTDVVQNATETAAGVNNVDYSNMGTSEMYQNWLRTALSGRGVLPQSAWQSAFTSGQNAINAQAQVSRQQFNSSVGQRGLLNSGIASRGLADIESGRLGAMGDMATNLQLQNLEAARLAQQQAAGLLAGSVNQQAALNANRPSLGQTLGDLAGTYLQYEAMRNAPQFLGFLPATLTNINKGVMPK